jgi:hypothetical protein
MGKMNLIATESKMISTKANPSDLPEEATATFFLTMSQAISSFQLRRYSTGLQPTNQQPHEG